jgi:MYXO-CTERM domain-containing protein
MLRSQSDVLQTLSRQLELSPERSLAFLGTLEPKVLTHRKRFSLESENGSATVEAGEVVFEDGNGTPILLADGLRLVDGAAKVGSRYVAPKKRPLPAAAFRSLAASTRPDSGPRTHSEPITMAVLSAGLVGALARRRRR